MQQALEIAKSALAAGDVPIGALVLNPEGKVISTGFNRREIDSDPSAHAEIVALREAATVNKSWRLDGHTIVVTLEPCPMCAGALYWSQIGTITFGAFDQHRGATRHTPSLFHPSTQIKGGIEEDTCAQLMKTFFERKR